MKHSKGAGNVALGAILSSLLLPVLLTGQVSRCSITGTVTDSQGNRIPDARVLLTQQSTGLERLTATSSQGTFFFERPASWSLCRQIF